MRTSSGSRFRWLPLIPSRGYAFKPVKDHHEEWDESHPRFSLSKDNPLSSGVDMFGTVWSRIMNGSKNWRCHTLLIFHQGQSLQNTSSCLLPSHQFPQTQNDKIIFPPAKINIPPDKIIFPPAKINFPPAKIIFPPAKIIFSPAKINFPQPK